MVKQISIVWWFAIGAWIAVAVSVAIVVAQTKTRDKPTIRQDEVKREFLKFIEAEFSRTDKDRDRLTTPGK